MTVAYVGLGSNMGDSRKIIAEALRELDAVPRTSVTARSPLYRSAPIGYEQQADFLNAVARLRTGLTPGELLAALIEIEERHGRSRSFANAPRTLDLDLLLHGETVLESERLTLPHPRMHERAFVLRPLLDIAPDIAIPGRGAAGLLLQDIRGQKVEKLG
jgi:2-amino-4-hydroxy-6-hydroxymethyldihydropteridine diphosphokinase